MVLDLRFGQLKVLNGSMSKGESSFNINTELFNWKKNAIDKSYGGPRPATQQATQEVFDEVERP